MKNIFHYLSIIALMLTVSCSTNSATNPPTENPVDVYVAGQKNGKACYWKNNQIIVLDNEIMSNSSATKIIVSNGDVYVFATFQMGIVPSLQYVYWKNGVMTNISNTFSSSPNFVDNIVDMEIVGNDVYFLGYTKKTSLSGNAASFVYWKNGVKTTVADYLNLNGLFNFGQIKIVNDTIFIIGAKDIAGTINNGYFVNNNFTSSFQTLNGIAVKGLDVYVYGGNFNQSNFYYKNLITGQEVSFFQGNDIAKMVFDSNNKYTSTGANVFKNDVSVFQRNGFPFDFITDFEVLNSNTYVLTQKGDLGTIDKLFINNIETLQINSTGNSNKFNAVIVVQN